MLHGYPAPFGDDPTLCGEPGIIAKSRDQITCPKCLAICKGGQAFREYMNRLKEKMRKGLN
jgi:hypothetical protein